MKISHNKDLSRLNTFGMKVRAACVVQWKDPVSLCSLDWPSLPAPVLPVGQGSNLLFTGDFPGTVLHSEYAKKEVLEERCGGDDVFVRAGAGMVWDEFCAWAASHEWWGVENLSGIPGTVGASPVQNIGAYGVEVGDVIDSVECFDIKDRCYVTFGGEDCEFAYRDSWFKHHRGRYVVVSVIFHLYRDFRPQLSYGRLAAEVERNVQLSSPSPDPYTVVYAPDRMAPRMPLSPMLVRNTVMAIRDGKLPPVSRVGSAGSFFKNPVVTAEVYDNVVKVVRQSRGEDAEVPHFEAGTPEQPLVKIPAAFLIDFCGLKGASSGGAAVWQKQPLVIVNADGKALPSDILALEKHIVDTVQSTFGIALSPEVDHI